MSHTDSSPDSMTINEVADYLKLSRSKLYAMAQGGELPCSKVAGQWRFFRPEIDERMLAQRAIPSESGRARRTRGGER